MEAAARDLRIPLPRPQAGFPSGIRRANQSVDVASGRVRIDMQTHAMTGYKFAAGLSAITGITYQDTANHFGGASEVRVLLMPVLSMRDSRGNVSMRALRMVLQTMST